MLLILIILASCNQPEATPSVSITTSPVTSTPLALQSTSTPNPPSPTSTFTVTTTPSPPTPTTTPSPTPVPTLKPDEVDRIVTNLLKSDYLCLAPPCFWGIIPGKTKAEDAFQFFSQMGYPDIDKYSSFDKETQIIRYGLNFQVEVPEIINIVLGLHEKDGIIQAIDVIIMGNEMSPEDIHAYTLKNILTWYGPPTRVRFYDNRNNRVQPGLRKPQTTSYSYSLYYDDLNMIIDIVPKTQILDGDFRRICPLANQTLQMIGLAYGKKPEKALYDMFDFSDTFFIEYPDPREFYDLIMNGDVNTCLTFRARDYLPVMPTPTPPVE
jgi:hypothetical protein